MRAMAGMDLRKPLVAALAADLVGPYAVDERLRLPPSRWYLTGFLVPKTVRDSDERDPTDDEEMAAGNDETEEESQGNAEPEPKQKNRLPASMGMSVLLPPGTPTETVTAMLTFAEYVFEEREVRRCSTTHGPSRPGRPSTCTPSAWSWTGATP